MIERRELGDFFNDFLLLGVMRAPESNLNGLIIGLRIESCDCFYWSTLPALFYLVSADGD